MRRHPLALLIIGSLFAAAPVLANDTALPEIGSSAAQIISPSQEAMYGRELLGELRRLGELMEDPVLEGWLSDLGFRLAARSERPEQPFTFFLLRARDINAFATLGGYVAMNAGLVLTAESEDEVAAVLAHEISHSTQRHIVRSVEAAQKDSIPILLATLGAVVAAQSAGGDSAGDASQAAVAGGLALLQQRQINFTRDNEHEADRIGIQILGRSGFEPMAMADFFGRMSRATRSQGDAVPDYLRTHPVTTTRISEAKDRAAKLARTSTALETTSERPLSPLIPERMHSAIQLNHGPDAVKFAFARERLRVLSAGSTSEAVAEYERRISAGESLSQAQRYGLAIAKVRAGHPDQALPILQALSEEFPALYWFPLAHAEAMDRSGRPVQADRQFEQLLASEPRNRAVALAYAAALAERGNREAGERAQRVLRPLLADSQQDAAFHVAFGRACELAGDLPRAAEAHAEAAYLSGRPEDALNQLQRVKDEGDIDYVQRARIDARIAAITPVVLELRERGINPGDELDRQEIDAGVRGWH